MNLDLPLNEAQGGDQNKNDMRKMDGIKHHPVAETAEIKAGSGMTRTTLYRPDSMQGLTTTERRQGRVIVHSRNSNLNVNNEASLKQKQEQMMIADE